MPWHVEEAECIEVDVVEGKTKCVVRTSVSASWRKPDVVAADVVVEEFDWSVLGAMIPLASHGRWTTEHEVFAHPSFQRVPHSSILRLGIASHAAKKTTSWMRSKVHEKDGREAAWPRKIDVDVQMMTMG